MKRSATFQIGDSVMQYDGANVTLLRGPRGPYVAVQGDVELLQEAIHPTITLPYQPDIVNGTVDALVKEYGGKVIRPASKLKFDPELVY